MAAVIEHRGLRVDAEAGVIYGRRGRPVGSCDSSGYLQIDLRSRGEGMVSAHRFIFEAARGPIPADREINHRNGVKTDNRIDNLELVTHAENVRHAYRTGLKSNAGERHPSHKLTAPQVGDIRRMHDGGESISTLALRFGVHRRTINDVVLRQSWAEVA